MTADARTTGGATDRALLAAVAKGDAGAFERVVAAHESAVWGLVRAVSHDTADAEDAWQEAFVAVYRHAGTYRGEASARTWILTVARNAAWRIRRRKSDVPLDDTRIDLGPRAGWGRDPADPETLASLAERRERLDAALATLSPEDREILTLRDLEGLSGPEAAAALGLAVPTMKSRLHRARLRLAAALREGGRP